MQYTVFSSLNVFIMTVLLCLFLVDASDAHAADNELTILTNPLPFFSETDQDGKPTGYSVELAKLIANRAQLSFTVSALPWARIMAQNESTNPVLILGLARTPERESDYHWVTTISQNQVAVFVKDLPTIPLTSFKMLDEFGYIAVLRDDYRQQILIDNNVENMVTFNSWKQAIKTLLRGRVESVFLSDMGLLLTCLQIKLDCRGVKKVLTHQVVQSYIAMPKTKVNDLIADRIKTSAIEVKNSDGFRTMASRFLNRQESLSQSLILKNGMVEVKNEQL